MVRKGFRPATVWTRTGQDSQRYEHCLVNCGFPLFWWKGHVSNGCKMYLFRSPVPMFTFRDPRNIPRILPWIPPTSHGLKEESFVAASRESFPLADRSSEGRFWQPSSSVQRLFSLEGWRGCLGSEQSLKPRVCVPVVPLAHRKTCWGVFIGKPQSQVQSELKFLHSATCVYQESQDE